MRALTVDGVLDPIAWSTGRDDQARTLPFSTRLRSDQGAYATLLEFFRLCDQGGPNCAFSQGDPQQRYAALAERLRRAPAQLPDGQGGTMPFTYNDPVAVTLGAMYAPDVWPDLAALLQQLDALTRPQAVAAALRTLQVRLGAYQQDYPEVIRPATSWADAAGRQDATLTPTP